MIRRRHIEIACAVALAASSTLAVAGRSFAASETPRGETVADHRERDPVAAYNKWKWFEDTYWIVPPDGIYSVYHALDTREFVVTRGQTVFHITDYFNGYFTGAVVVKLSAALVPSCQYMLGQVTPEGRVYMTMYDATTGAITNTPLGTMVKKNGKWTMVNQMTGPAAGGTLSHWAYMVQSRREDPSFRNLPFAHESIPEFLSACPDGPKIRQP